MTQRDIARLAGVSQAAVSAVLSGSGIGIGVEAQAKIRQAAAELGYVPNVFAQALKTNRTHTVACVVPDIANPFYPPLVRGVQAVMELAGYDVIAVSTDGIAAQEQRFVEWSINRRLAGVVGVFFTLNIVQLKALVDNGIFLARFESGAKRGGALAIDDFYVDNEAAARELTRHLMSLGHRRIAMITAPGGPERARTSGYVTVMTEAGLQPQILQADAYTDAEGRRCATELLAVPADRPTAVIGADDLIAFGALQACRDLGLSIPSQVAVAGFDNIFAAEFVSPPLTTVSLFQKDAGAAAARSLLDRLDGRLTGPGTAREMPFSLIARESTVGDLRLHSLETKHDAS